MSAAKVVPVFRSRTNGSVRAPFESDATRFEASEEKPIREPSNDVDGGPAPPSAAAGGDVMSVPNAAVRADALRLVKRQRAARAGSAPGGKTSGDGRNSCPESA